MNRGLVLRPCLLALVVLLQAGCASDGSLSKPNFISDDGNGWETGFEMR
jgi:hypothetical protein